MSRPTRRLLVAIAVLSAGPLRAADLPAGYPLTVSPVDALDGLAKLPGPSAGKLSEAERRVLAAAWKRAGGPAADRKDAKPAEVFEALLFASGTDSDKTRAKYRKEFESLVADAEKAVKGAADPGEKADRLLRFLHDGVMKNKYSLDQSSFTGVFDEGQFNCVSGTAMCYLVGSRLGLELKPQEVPGDGFQPGHAWLELVANRKRIDVECTTADGFDFEAKLKRPGVRRIGPAVDTSKKRETDGFGVAAITYSNRGVAEKDNRAAAIRCYLSALALDPADRTAANNLRSAFVNWGPELSKDGKYEEAVAVLAHGLKLVPGDDKMRNNQRVVWIEFLTATLDREEDGELAGRLARAKAAVGGSDFDSAADWYVRLAHKRIGDGWEKALTVLDRGMTAVPEGDRKALRRERVGFCRQWSQERLDAEDADGSLKALSAAGDGDADGLEAGLAYHAQKALAKLWKDGGAKAVAAHYADLWKRFPEAKGTAEVAAQHVRRVVSDTARNGSLTDALKAAEELAGLLPTAQAKADVCGNAYCEAAERLVKEEKWEDAMKVFADGLKAQPKHGRLLNNSVATVDRWARTAMQNKDWDEAIRIYDAGLTYLPGNDHLKHNKSYCEAMKEKGR